MLPMQEKDQKHIKATKDIIKLKETIYATIYKFK